MKTNQIYVATNDSGNRGGKSGQKGGGIMLQEDRDHAFESLILIFADFFKYPEKVLYEELVSGELDQSIQRLGLITNNQISIDLKSLTQSYEHLVETYNKCFLGVTSPYAPLVESVYKVWTCDQSYQVPFKNQKGYLLGDSALHIKHILAELGLEIPPEYEMMPDHLSILLELYAYLYSKGFKNEARQFVHDHLDWLPELSNALTALDSNQPYAAALAELQGILFTKPKEIN